MNQDIHTHLEKLKEELNKLEPAVKHLQDADKNATNLVTTLTEMHKGFSKHLQNIEDSLAKANDKHLMLITKDIQDAIIKLNDLGNFISKSFNGIQKNSEELFNRYKTLATDTEKILTKIDKVDFPIRLDKLDATVSSINQGIQNTQSRIGDLERNLKDDIQAKTKEITTGINTTENSLKVKLENIDGKLTTQFEKMEAANKLMKILLISSVTLNAIALIIYIFIRIKT